MIKKHWSSFQNLLIRIIFRKTKEFPHLYILLLLNFNQQMVCAVTPQYNILANISLIRLV